MNVIKTILTMGLFAFFVTGCVNETDEVAEFNKPASYWYNQIAKSIKENNMDKADAYYVSLRSEHITSGLMPTATMMLAHAHLNNEEYKLSNYYLDEYNKRYGKEKTSAHIEFLKLKASFLGIQDVYKDQQLIMNTTMKVKTYILRYPDSTYIPLVKTMLARLYMSQYLLNENIASLYQRIRKPHAAKIYRAKNADSVVEMTDITPPKKGIIGEIFD